MVVDGFLSLPIPFPLQTDRVGERQCNSAIGQPAIVHATMILVPGRMGGILMKMLRG